MREGRRDARRCSRSRSGCAGFAPAPARGDAARRRARRARLPDRPGARDGRALPRGARGLRARAAQGSAGRLPAEARWPSCRRARSASPTRWSTPSARFELEPDDEGLRLFLGSLYRIRREPESAARVLQDAEGEPVSTDAALLLFGIWLEAERNSEAKAIAEWLIEHEPDVGARLRRARRGDRAHGRCAGRRGGAAPRPRGAAGRARAVRRARAQPPRARRPRRRDRHLSRDPRRRTPTTTPRCSPSPTRRSRSARRRRPPRRSSGSRPPTPTTCAPSSSSASAATRPATSRPPSGASCARSRQQPEQHEIAYFLGVVQRKMGKAAEAIAELRPHPARCTSATRTRACRWPGSTRSRATSPPRASRSRSAREVEPSRPLDLYAASLQAKARRRAGRDRVPRGPARRGARGRRGALQHRRHPRRGEERRGGDPLHADRARA